MTYADPIEPTSDVLATLAAALQAVFADIEAMRNDQSPPAPEPASVDMAELRQQLMELQALLAQDDIRASTLWQTIEPLLVSAVSMEESNKLAQQMDKFDFPDALLTLRAILSDHWPATEE